MKWDVSSCLGHALESPSKVSSDIPVMIDRHHTFKFWMPKSSV